MQAQKGTEAADTRLQHVGRSVALWWLSGDSDDLDNAVATATAMGHAVPGDVIYLADAVAWVAEALETKDPARAATWRGHAERSMAAVYPAGHTVAYVAGPHARLRLGREVIGAPYTYCSMDSCYFEAIRSVQGSLVHGRPI